MNKSPVIFVHGIGASASVWKRFDFPDHAIYYISFTNRFAAPSKQVPELAKYIKEVLKITQQQKVILVCHSMGGLVARKYLVDHKNSNNVEKLILLSAPNLGSVGLSFNWLPFVLMMLGAIGFSYVWPLILVLIGLIWEIISYFRGVLLLSPASWAMRPNSKFLKDLNSKDAPVNVKYISVLSDTKVFPHRLVNFFLFREGGDGAIPISSQSLSKKCVPNFSRLNHTELHVDLPHFEIPVKCESIVKQALEL
jgi:pimeloyl-ACP methyl ester carboxylesterase